MRKRWPFVLVIIIVVLIAVAWLFPTTVYLPVGLVKGEAMFDGKPTDYWVHALKKEGFLGGSPPPGDAGKTLRDGGAAAVPVLCEIAQCSDNNLRLQALTALELMGLEAKAAKPILEAIVKTDPDSSLMTAAARTLGNVDPSAAGEALAAVLREKPEGTFLRQRFACAVLISLAPQGQEAVPAAQAIVDDQQQKPQLQVQAIDVLWRMKQPAEPLLQILCSHVKDPKSPVGVPSLEVLGAMGPIAKSAVPTLIEVLGRTDLPLTGRRDGPANRAQIYRTIGMIGPNASLAIPQILSTIQSQAYFDRRHVRDNYNLRTEVALALVRMGPAGKQIVTVRDAVWSSSITLLGAQAPVNILVPSLADIQIRTWLPRKGDSSVDIQKAVWYVDPLASRRAGYPAPVRADEADLYKDDE
jgi:HEAT repeat protein